MELLLLVCLCLLSCSANGQGGNVPAKKPSILTITSPGEQALRCDSVGSSPKPTMVWQDGSGRSLPTRNLKETESGGLFTVQLETVVTKSGIYRCVVSQKEIGVEVSAEINITYSGAAAGPGFNTGLVMLWFLVFLYLF